jgi:hypothetical protein
VNELHIISSHNMQTIEDALRRHDCEPALQWCADNHARLAKLKSSLPFRLRLQQFIMVSFFGIVVIGSP